MASIMSEEELRNVFDSLIPLMRLKFRELKYDALYAEALVAEMREIFDKKIATEALRFDSAKVFASWLLGVAFFLHKKHWFLCLGQIFKKGENPTEYDEDTLYGLFDYDFAHRLHPEESLIVLEEIRALDAAYRALPEEYRERMEGTSIPGLSNDPVAIRVRKHRAMQDAEEWLREAGVTCKDDAIEYGAKILRGLPVYYPRVTKRRK